MTDPVRQVEEKYGAQAAEHVKSALNKYSHGQIAEAMVEQFKAGIAADRHILGRATDRIDASIEEAVATAFTKIGGEQAGEYYRAGVKAFNQGLVVEGIKNALAADGDILHHVAGPSAPLQTPASSSPVNSRRER